MAVRAVLQAALLLATLAAPRSSGAEVEARAELEWTADLSVGGGAIVWPEGEAEGLFRFGAHTEVTFLRRTNRDVGLGVYGEVMTSGFLDVTAGFGASLLLPVHRAMPLVLSVGPHYTYSGAHDAGLGGRLWWGFRNHNHFHPYNTTFGLWVEARGDLTGEGRVLVAGGVDVDVAILAYPFMLLDRWARGPERL